MRRKKLQPQTPISMPLIDHQCMGKYDSTMHENPGKCLYCANNRQCQKDTANILREL